MFEIPQKPLKSMIFQRKLLQPIMTYLTLWHIRGVLFCKFEWHYFNITFLELKSGDVKPVFKKDSQNDKNNYSPLSISVDLEKFIYYPPFLSMIETERIQKQPPDIFCKKICF